MSVDFVAVVNHKPPPGGIDVDVSGVDDQGDKVSASFNISRSDEYGFCFAMSAFSLNGVSLYHHDWDADIDIFDEDLVIADIKDATGYVNKEGLCAIYASLDEQVGEILRKSRQVKRNIF